MQFFFQFTLSCLEVEYIYTDDLVLKRLGEVKIIESYVDESCIYVHHIWRTSEDKSSTSLNTRRLLVEGGKRRGGTGRRVRLTDDTCRYRVSVKRHHIPLFPPYPSLICI